MTTSTIDVKGIVADKIQTMLDDQTIKNKIEETIEKDILRTISESVSSYEVKNILEKKLKDDISQQISTISLTGYTKRILDQIKLIIESQQNKDLSDKVIKIFEDLYLPNCDKELTQDDIIQKYEESIKDYYDYSDEKQICYRISQETGYTYSSGYKILLSTNDDFEKNNDTYEISLINIGNSDKFKIVSIYEDREYSKDITKRIKICTFNSFERFLLNSYFNEVAIIDLKEDQGEYDPNEP